MEEEEEMKGKEKKGGEMEDKDKDNSILLVSSFSSTFSLPDQSNIFFRCTLDKHRRNT